jgi:MFS family permease
VRRAIPEADPWQRVAAQRRAALERKRSGAALGAQDQALARFTVADLFADPEIRRRTILAFLMSLATTFAFWGISTWIPPYVASVATAAGLPGQQWASYAGMAYNGASIIGYAGFGFLADAYGRKPVTLFYVAMALIMVPISFLWAHDLGILLVCAGLLGVFVSGQYTWMSAWLPELFPTRVRATGAGFVFNMPRLIAWIGPLIAGSLIANFGSFGRAAMAISLIYILSLVCAPFLPETKGKPLPT